MTFKYGTSPFRDFVASMVVLAIAVLLVRCAYWLWRERPFWADPRSRRDVVTMIAVVLVAPFAVVFERQLSGSAKDALHLGLVLLLASIYAFMATRPRPTELNETESDPLDSYDDLDVD